MGNLQPDYSALVAEAEKAVAAVKDPELKQAAFTKVLDTLLARASEQSTHANNEERSTKQSKSTKNLTQSKQAKRSGGPMAYIGELIEEGFFKTQRTMAAIKTELGNRGHHIPLTGLSTPLQRLCQQKQLRREKKADGKKTIFAYSKY